MSINKAKEFRNLFPMKRNIAIAVVSYSLATTFLYMANINQNSILILPWALCFALTGNTIFSLLHESVHGTFCKNKFINNTFGRVSAAFFPTSFTLQQIFHLGHHKRNRTDAELFDQYYPKDSKFMKKFIIYTLLTGFYWPSSPLANIIFLLCPWLFNNDFFRKNDLMKKAGFDDMLSGLDRKSAPQNLMRLEILFSISIQAALIYTLSLSFKTWIICYWSFAVIWSSLQYTDHAWSKRDVRNGAWNLKVSLPVHMIWLNYHYHLNHHRDPNISWLYLPRLTRSSDANPSFWSIYFKLWKGPTPVSEVNPSCDLEFEKEIFEETLINDFRKK
ncbi:fatty acid desaturase [Halobacteriovorax sp. HLS]|uniref:fatty acid desaturase family protein n=1 Tax=Halobacteriovorax sp. HLS TaxID=2234000 RepID=UPI000FDA22C7|nr:fatty acid desaturase [Halobacteriovorax sp. HLS]